MIARMAPGMPITTAIIARTALMITEVFHMGALVVDVELSVDIVILGKKTCGGEVGRMYAYANKSQVDAKLISCVIWMDASAD
jgi:hypothetical protein